MFKGIKAATGVCATLILLSVVCVKASVPAAPQDSDVVTVKMTADHVFDPVKVTIKVGQTVEWVNAEEGGLHQVTNDPDVASDGGDVSVPDGTMPFNSQMMRSGKTFRHQFTIPGVYKYTCPPHESAGMVGEVDVTK
jgi:plastocyanin